MPITRIPERARPGISKLRALTSENTEELVAAVERCQASADFSRFVSCVSSGTPSIPSAEVKDILQALYSLSAAMGEGNGSLALALDELCQAMRSSGKDDLKIDEGEEKVFKTRLGRLLRSQSLSVSAKALRLRTEYERTFCDARILTDLRPIFADVQEKPVGIVANHILKLEYHEGKEHKEFYVALDDQDLKKVREAIERAETKARSLRSFLRASGTTDFDQT